MNLQQEEKQRKKFRDILRTLAESQTLLEDSEKSKSIYRKLEDLYYPKSGEESFRHFYSDIFSELSLIRKEESKGSIDILGQNLSEIRKNYIPKNLDTDGNIIDISASIRKLFDHVNLDIARILYSDGGDDKLARDADLKTVKQRVNELTTNINKTADSIKNAQKENITILGIFSAVVLAFTGGIAFTTSVFEHLHQSSIYRVVLITLLIGLILTNLLYALFFYVEKLIAKPKEIGMKPVGIINVIILLLMFITFMAWNEGWVEERNTRIFHAPLPTASATASSVESNKLVITAEQEENK